MPSQGHPGRLLPHYHQGWWVGHSSANLTHPCAGSEKNIKTGSIRIRSSTGSLRLAKDPKKAEVGQVSATKTRNQSRETYHPCNQKILSKETARGQRWHSAKRMPKEQALLQLGSYQLPTSFQGETTSSTTIYINTLPTRVRLSRGERRRHRTTRCRAGCRATETSTHVIQNCWRTNGARIKRHNAMSKAIAKELREKGWAVEEEPHIRTKAGLRKPDIIARRDDKGVIIDTQIISTTAEKQLTYHHKNKYGKEADLT